MEAAIHAVFTGRPVLVSDFDGTMTVEDFFQCVLAHLPPDAGGDDWERYVSGELTHFEALRSIFRHVPDDEAAALAVARETRLAPGLADGIARLHKAGWDVVVVSAGCEWYIERLLAEQQVQVPVFANPGRLVPGRGLEMAFPAESPFQSPQTGIDKEAVVRRALAECRDVAFAGDGRPDLAPALLVEPRCRFARGWLADELARQGVPFQQFVVWSDVPGLLLNEFAPE